MGHPVRLQHPEGEHSSLGAPPAGRHALSAQRSSSYELALNRQSLACTPVLYGPSPSVLPTEKTRGHCQGDPTQANSSSNILITVIDQGLNSLIGIAMKAHCIESGFPLLASHKS